MQVKVNWTKKKVFNSFESTFSNHVEDVFNFFKGQELCSGNYYARRVYDLG